ncbi:hypothetical protein [Streptomyces telluris]|uniref:Uncharacterized protein n=1 Tax=Streptomyces telluris TaxID=2720021 RepID=A0A9X2LHH9_9ACTN|nr:hypothetical protein [Streptomyces telluris]MCQ8769970.1 hypothetical protein [Streptomyces telluris]NJP77339.1 hypothetical protein [Streptomyces telluris]
MARNENPAGFAWFMIVVSVLLTLGLAVDWADGEGFDWTTAAWLFVLWPYALGDVLRARGRRRAAGRVGTVANWSPFPATAVLWTGLVLGWTRGEGTDWFALAGALLLPAAGALWLAAKVAERRREARLAARRLRRAGAGA